MLNGAALLPLDRDPVALGLSVQGQPRVRFLSGCHQV